MLFSRSSNLLKHTHFGPTFTLHIEKPRCVGSFSLILGSQEQNCLLEAFSTELVVDECVGPPLSLLWVGTAFALWKPSKVEPEIHVTEGGTWDTPQTKVSVFPVN